MVRIQAIACVRSLGQGMLRSELSLLCRQAGMCRVRGPEPHSKRRGAIVLEFTSSPMKHQQNKLPSDYAHLQACVLQHQRNELPSTHKLHNPS